MSIEVCGLGAAESDGARLTPTLVDCQSMLHPGVRATERYVEEEESVAPHQSANVAAASTPVQRDSSGVDHVVRGRDMVIHPLPVRPGGGATEVRGQNSSPVEIGAHGSASSGSRWRHLTYAVGGRVSTGHCGSCRKGDRFLPSNMQKKWRQSLSQTVSAGSEHSQTV